jgi:hypothetical protein
MKRRKFIQSTALGLGSLSLGAGYDLLALG